MALRTSSPRALKPPAPASGPAELSAAQLYHPCDPTSLKFNTTSELPDLKTVIGQPRAIRALEMASEVSGPGFNIFVLGQPGSGRTTLSQEYLVRKAVNEPVPDDWCYLNNFDNPHRPRALRLPAGQGAEFRKEMHGLVSFVQAEVSRLFQSNEYTSAKEQILSEIKQIQESEFNRLQEYVERNQFLLARTPFGFVLTPGVQGKPLKPEDVERLTPEQKAKVEQLAKKLGEEVERTLAKLREMAQQTASRLGELDAHSVQFALSPRLETLKTRFGALPDVLAYLDAVQADLVAHAARFHPSDSSDGSPPSLDEAWFDRYAVNLLVDHAGQQGAPVVVESQPNYHNLLGRIEHEVIMGATRTDFTHIRPGALHRANGGYLVAPARDLLLAPYAWEGLKRVLRDGAIRIIELGTQLGMVSTETLDPEPIPLHVKIVLVGTPMLYYLLRAYDEDFAKLFKVRAEFATMMERTPQSEEEYALFVRSVVDDNALPHFTAGGVARIIEHSSRLAEDQEKLSTRFGAIADLLREAAYWARKENQELVDEQAVQQAIQESIYRSNLLEIRLQEMVEQDTLLIEVSGNAVGQVNALSVHSLGDYAFGRPTRLTAAAHPGQGGVVDIERQAKLGGPIHTKGVLILSGYLSASYGQRKPLNLSASLTFEQSYDEVEGDSASAAELIALLSAIAGVPILQERAITGSVNQRGLVQAIGGVNEKIEGFFDICCAKELTGKQGVVIPQANLRHLMLKQAARDAVAAGKFHIWPVRTIEEAIECLTEMPAGQADARGRYPAGSFNHAVMQRLAAFERAGKPPQRKGAHAKEEIEPN
jgi:lon-related putative ATP-dependent protease